MESIDRSSWRDVEWLACADGKARSTQPGIHPLADGLPGRVGQLRAYGNSIVPPLAADIRAGLHGMQPMTAAVIASILQARRPDSAGRYRVLGVCHSARSNPSLSIWDGDNGGLGAYCFAGCEYPAIVAALERTTGLPLRKERNP